MSVIALQQNIEDEQSGEINNLELIALKYTGSKSSIAPRGALNTQGKWPGTAPLNHGNWYFALNPDEGLAYLEHREDLDLVYADHRKRFAEALLSQNRLPDNVFGRGADRDLQDRVFDALDLEEPMQAGPVEEQLRRIAGIDENEADDADTAEGRASTLVEEYTRDQLKSAVEEVREGADEFSLRGAGVTEMAEYLAGESDAEVNDALPSTDGDD